MTDDTFEAVAAAGDGPRKKAAPRTGSALARAVRSLPFAGEPFGLLALALVALLAAALVPMLAISAFDHSYADDWHYAVGAHLALEAGGGAAAALRAALDEVVDAYFSWQGTYSAIFLMALQPGVLGEELYGAGAVAVLALLVLATGYFASVLVRDVLGAGRSSWICASAAVLLLQTQLLPSPVEGIWWYNSAVYYTFYHALMLVMAGLSLRLLRGSTRRGDLGRRGTAVRAVALAALAFVVAGGNFVTGIVSVLALAGLVFAGIALGRRRAAVLVPALAVLVVGFALSMAAPGNEIRQESQFPTDALGPAVTIVRSCLAGAEYTVLWTNGMLAVALAALAPVLVRAAVRSQWSFSRPWLACAASLALFMASFTPTFFSMGSVGPGRVQNIRYDLFVILVFVCATWLIGWACRRLERGGFDFGLFGAAGPSTVVGPGAAPADAPSAEGDGREVPAAPMVPRMRPAAVYYLSLALVLALCLGALALDERHVDDVVAISCARSLANGEAAEYDEQIWERIELIEGTDAADVEVPFITRAPRVLFMGDIKDNMDTYINFRLAQWYGKDSIIGYDSVID